MSAKIIWISIAAFLVSACATVPSKEKIYAIPYLGEDWGVYIEIPPGKTRAQAEADGSAQYVVDGRKRYMRCDGTVQDCRRTLVDLRERIGTIGDSGN